MRYWVCKDFDGRYVQSFDESTGAVEMTDVPSRAMYTTDEDDFKAILRCRSGLRLDTLLIYDGAWSAREASRRLADIMSAQCGSQTPYFIVNGDPTTLYMYAGISQLSDHDRLLFDLKPSWAVEEVDAVAKELLRAASVCNVRTTIEQCTALVATAGDAETARKLFPEFVLRLRDS